jgi:CRISPR-associated exonuclease Cas4
MSVPTWWIAVAAVLGLWLMLAGRGMRQRRGLGGGKTVSLDRVTLTSRRLGMTGRPDRLIKTGGSIVVEEWKSARTLRPWHRAQMGCYFLLIEEELRIRPPHGFIACGDGTRHRIDNTEELRAWVLELAGKIRAARAAVSQPLPVNPRPGQCRPCGVRGHCNTPHLSIGRALYDINPLASVINWCQE